MPPPVSRAPRCFSHTSPARALPPVGACRIRAPLSPPRGHRFSTRPPPAPCRRWGRAVSSSSSPARKPCAGRFPTRPRPRGAPTVSHTSPARAAAATVFPTHPPPAPCRRWGRTVFGLLFPLPQAAPRAVFSHAPARAARPLFSHTSPARAARPSFLTRPPPARRAHRFSHTSPARALPPVGACRIRPPLPPPVSRAPRCFSHTPPARKPRPGRFFTCSRPRCFSHTPPARAARPPFFHTSPARHFPTRASPRPPPRVLTGRAAMAYNTDYI